MEDSIKTIIDPVSGIEPKTIKTNDILAVYCTPSYVNDVLKLIKITIVQKGNVETIYHEGIDSSELEYTLRDLLDNLGGKFKFNKKYSIIINSDECDIEKFNAQNGLFKKKNVILPFKDGTKVNLETDKISMKGLRDISKPQKSNYEPDFSSGSM